MPTDTNAPNDMQILLSKLAEGFPESVARKLLTRDGLNRIANYQCPKCGADLTSPASPVGRKTDRSLSSCIIWVCKACEISFGFSMLVPPTMANDDAITN